MERAVLVYMTFPSIVEAERAGRVLVERRLCACVNILPGMVSHYWWQGAVERGEEAVAGGVQLDAAVTCGNSVTPSIAV